MRLNLVLQRFFTAAFALTWAATTFAAPTPPSAQPSRFAAQTITDSPEAVKVAAETEVAEDGGLIGYARTGAALCFVVTLIVLLGWGYKRLSGNRVAGGSAAITVLGRGHVSPRAGVVLLKVGRRVLVCAESSGQPLTTLSEITDEAEVGELVARLSGGRPEPQRPFAAALGVAGADYGEPDGYPDPADSEVAAALQQEQENGEFKDTSSDIAGLMERVRTLSRQLRTNGDAA